MINWIRTRDKLPPEDVEVLAYNSGQLSLDEYEICTAKYIDYEWHIGYGMRLYNVPYWAHLNVPTVSENDHCVSIMHDHFEKRFNICAVCGQEASNRNDRFFVIPLNVFLANRYSLCDKHKDEQLNFDYFYNEDLTIKKIKFETN